MLSFKQVDLAISQWKRPKDLDEARRLMGSCLLDPKNHPWAPPHFVPETKEDLAEMDAGFLTDDTAPFARSLAEINDEGMLTLDSQPGSIERGYSELKKRNYVIKQRAYVIGIMLREDIGPFIEAMGSHHEVLVGAVPKSHAPVLTEQNGEAVTLGRNMGIKDMAKYLADMRDRSGAPIFNKSLISDIYNNCNTVLVYSEKFGESPLFERISLALRMSS